MDEAAVRDRLTAERRAAVERIAAMRSELDGIVAATEGANSDDEHDPEGATIAYERARVSALIAGARANVDDLDRALARLRAGSYARCDGCGGEIAPERLAALPATRTCIDCASIGRSG